MVIVLVCEGVLTWSCIVGDVAASVEGRIDGLDGMLILGPWEVYEAAEDKETVVFRTC